MSIIRTYKEVRCKACKETGRIQRNEDQLYSSFSGEDTGKLFQEICLGCNGIGIQSFLIGEIDKDDDPTA